MIKVIIHFVEGSERGMTGWKAWAYKGTQFLETGIMESEVSALCALDFKFEQFGTRLFAQEFVVIHT